jgi:arylsulfatase A-like enzyme
MKAKIVVLISSLLVTSYLFAQDLPKPVPPFNGTIGKTYKDSKEDFPEPLTPPKGAPNVLLVLIDDIGFGATSTFGGLIPTPNLDKLAKGGVMYNRFHTTSLCSPTRAALLTGRNHHQAGFGTISEGGTGYPGYSTVWGQDIASIPEVLLLNGYNTAAFGKWHNTPDWESSPSGPFDRWPTGKGFERFFGFIGGETSQWTPQLYDNITPVEPEKTPGKDYLLTPDLTNRSIEWLRLHNSISPDKPWFLYFATGATHAPHHVSKDWIAKYKGKFNMGWDKYREEALAQQKKLGIVPANTVLTKRPAEIPAWDNLSANQKMLYERQMEVFAAYTAEADYEIGRLINAVKNSPNADNTMIICIVGDNGASAEGGLTGTINDVASMNGIPDNVIDMLKHIDQLGGDSMDNHFSVGWALAIDAPFQWTKQVASHFGGTRNGLIINWPKRIAAHSGVRSQFHDVIDIAPTIYDAAHITFPDKVNGITQVPLAGTSMAYTYDDASAKGHRSTQYFEEYGNRAIYHDGWVAAARHGLPWVLVGRKGDFENDQWELYNIDEDFSEANNLAASNPKKLEEMKKIFDEEAKKYNVYPLDDRFAERGADPLRPSFTRGKTSFTYYPGAVRIAEGSAPSIHMRSHSITADVKIAGGTKGVIVAQGGNLGGYTLYIKDNKVFYENNYFGKNIDVITSTIPLPQGNDVIKFEYTQESKEYAGGGTGRLYINGKLAGEKRFAHVVPIRFSATETFDVGEERGSTVSKSYTAPYKFTGELKKVTVDLK